MDLKIIYQDDDVLVVDKPAGMVVYLEAESGANSDEFGAAPAGAAQVTGEKTLIDALTEQFPDLKNVGEAPRFGLVHRLDKDTSGLILVAKTQEALIFLQKKFITRELEKKYLALVCGSLKDDSGTIHTLIGRSESNPRKQVAHSLGYQGKTGLREAVSEYKVLWRGEQFTLVEVAITTGRRHQIRCHMAYLRHPVAGDELYGFKDSPVIEGLTRQFLHASYLKLILPNGQEKEFQSELPKELQTILNNLEKHGNVNRKV